jgi:hypothetical protein
MADTSVEPVRSAAMAFFSAMGGGSTHFRFFAFVNKEAFAYTVIHMVPRKDFIIFTAAVCIKLWAYSRLLKGLLPQVKTEFIIPSVKAAALAQADSITSASLLSPLARTASSEMVGIL